VCPSAQLISSTCSLLLTSMDCGFTELPDGILVFAIEMVGL
jgi:hypothetical protein